MFLQEWRKPFVLLLNRKGREYLSSHKAKTLEAAAVLPPTTKAGEGVGEGDTVPWRLVWPFMKSYLVAFLNTHTLRGRQPLPGKHLPPEMRTQRASGKSRKPVPCGATRRSVGTDARCLYRWGEQSSHIRLRKERVGTSTVQTKGPSTVLRLNAGSTTQICMELKS